MEKYLQSQLSNITNKVLSREYIVVNQGIEQDNDGQWCAVIVLQNRLNPDEIKTYKYKYVRL